MQGSVLKKVLPEGFEVDTVGWKFEHPYHISRILDVLTRYFYLERERMKLSGSKPDPLLFPPDILKQDVVNPTILGLLDLFRVPHDGSLEDIGAQTQKLWLRSSSIMPWELKDAYVGERSRLVPFFTRAGFVDEIAPKKRAYKYACIHKACLPIFVKRLSYLIDLFKQGVRFDSIVVLTARRPLFVIEEPLVPLKKGIGALPVKGDWRMTKDRPSVLADAVRLIFEQVELPEGMKDIPVHVVAPPVLKDPDGSARCPSTAENVLAWVKRDPEPGLCLTISSQPFIRHQDAVAKVFFPPELPFETVGPEADEPFHVSTALDTVARFLQHEMTWLQQTGGNNSVLFQK